MKLRNHNGSPQTGANPSRPWAADHSPLFHLSPDDSLSVLQSFEGQFATGQTGSGKTTGFGQAALRAFMRGGYGCLCTTTKPDDARTMIKWACLEGREQDIRLVNPQQPYRLSLLDYAYHQEGSRGAGETDNVVALLSELLEFKNRSREAGGESQFWYDYAKKTLGHIIDLVACAGATITFQSIYKVLQSIPHTLEEVRSREWQEKAFSNQLVDRAIANTKLSRIQQKDLALALEFILAVLPRMDERLRSNILATLDSITYPFLRGQLADLCGGEQTTLRPEDTFDGAIIILDLPIKEFHQTGAMIQVLWSRLWQQAVEKRDIQRFPRPVCWFSDECHNFLTRQSPLFAATARSSRCALLLMSQNLDALQTQVGKSETEALLGNLNYKVWCSNAHVSTNEWAAKTIGQSWVLGSNTNVSLGGEGSASGGTSEQLRYPRRNLGFRLLAKRRRREQLPSGGYRLSQRTKIYRLWREPSARAVPTKYWCAGRRLTWRLLMQDSIELEQDLYTHFARIHAFLPESVKGFLVLLKLLFEDLLAWCTRPVEVVLRRRFGTRGHSVFRTVQISVAGCCLLVVGVWHDPLLGLFGLLSAGLAIYHLVEAQRSERRKLSSRYSWSHGEPSPLWGYAARGLKALGVNPGRVLSVAMICRFGEPLVCLLFALACWPLSKVLGIYLCCCTVGLLVKGFLVQQRIVNMQRDQMDARILSQWLIGLQQGAAGQGEQRRYVVQLSEPVFEEAGDSHTPTVPPKEQPAGTSVTTGEYLKIHCGNCQQPIRIHRKHRGRQGRCKKCGAGVTVA